MIGFFWYNSLIVNMVNIHMFHDEDNLVALEQVRLPLLILLLYMYMYM